MCIVVKSRKKGFEMKIAKNVENLLTKFENLVEKWAKTLF